MDIFKEYEKLKENIEFKKFLRDNTDYYLVHILVPEELNSLEFGFFSPKKNKIIIFSTNPINKGNEDDVFKEGKTITKLEMNKIKINYDEAIQKATELIKKDHPKEIINKKIVLLQHIQEPVWNLTFICLNLNIINIRINAQNANMVRNNKSSLMDMTGMAK